jgi:hypothetical protein
MDLRVLSYFVAVAEELHFGRAAVRLHMTQPPLSRAIAQLEADLGCVLLRRSPAGVSLTPAGALLHDEARTLLAQADQVRVKVAAEAGAGTITIGTLADSAEQVGTRVLAAFRERHPGIRVRIREAGFTDPTAALPSAWPSWPAGGGAGCPTASTRSGGPTGMARGRARTVTGRRCEPSTSACSLSCGAARWG